MSGNASINFPNLPFGRPTLRILVIGPTRAVQDFIRTQYRLGFAEVNEWSRSQPTSDPDEVVSILTRPVPPRSE